MTSQCCRVRVVLGGPEALTIRHGHAMADRRLPLPPAPPHGHPRCIAVSVHRAALRPARGRPRRRGRTVLLQTAATGWSLNTTGGPAAAQAAPASNKSEEDALAISAAAAPAGPLPETPGLPTLDISVSTADVFGMYDGQPVEVRFMQSAVWLESAVVATEFGLCESVAEQIRHQVKAKGAILVHQGHWVHLEDGEPPTIRVLSALPTVQGFIGSDTRVFVIEEAANTMANDKDVISTQSGDSDASLPLLHTFAARMGISQPNLRLRILLDTASPEWEHRGVHRGTTVAVAVSQWWSMPSKVSPAPICFSDGLDEDNSVGSDRAVYLSADMMKAYGCVHGDWMSLTAEGAEHFEVVAQVRVAPSRPDRLTVMPLLADNLWQQLVARRPDCTWVASRCHAPALAQRLWLARVHSPDDSGSDAAFGSAVVNLFRSPRIISVGDVLRLDAAEYSGYAKVVGLSTAVQSMDVPDVGLPGPTSPHTAIVSSVTAVFERTQVASRLLPSVVRVPTSGISSRIAAILASCDRLDGADDGGRALGRSAHSTLLFGPRGTGKTFWVEQYAAWYGLHLHAVSCYTLRGPTAKETVENVEQVLKVASTCRPCVVLLEHIHALAPSSRQDGAEAVDPTMVRLVRVLRLLVSPADTDSDENPLGALTWLVGTTHMADDDLGDGLVDCFVHRIDAEGPDEDQRMAFLEMIWKDVDGDPAVDLRTIAKDTAGLMPRDLHVLVQLARQAAHFRVNKGVAARLALDIGEVVCNEDVASALETVKGEQTRAIGVPKIPNVSWEDIGGLATAKKDILDTVQVPLENPDLFTAGLRRSGVLLYGPPGTGKTLLAKAVATECSLNFFSVKGPELINMYIGQSEANIRAVFERARAARPCVVFFDELDSLAPSRGRSGDSGGVMDRIVSQLLAEIDGLHSGKDVFIIGATNRPDLLDSALLRPGRLDKMIYLGMPDRENQERILVAQTRKMTVAADVDMAQVAECLPPNLTGADLYALSADATMAAIRRTIKAVEENPSTDEPDGHVKRPGPVQVRREDFARAIANLRPSVSLRELKRYEALHKQFNAKRSEA